MRGVPRETARSALVCRRRSARVLSDQRAGLCESIASLIIRRPPSAFRETSRLLVGRIAARSAIMHHGQPRHTVRGVDHTRFAHAVHLPHFLSDIPAPAQRRRTGSRFISGQVLLGPADCYVAHRRGTPYSKQEDELQARRTHFRSSLFPSLSPASVHAPNHPASSNPQAVHPSSPICSCNQPLAHPATRSLPDFASSYADGRPWSFFVHARSFPARQRSDTNDVQ